MSTSQHELLREVVALLEEAGIPYMLTGSLAATYHGRPRTTQDIDLVVDADRVSLATFVRNAVRAGLYADPDDAQVALARRSMFNLVDAQSGYKVDLIIRKDRDFSREEFARRSKRDLPGLTVSMVSPEDSILSKLEWAAMGASERQYQDALAIVQIRRISPEKKSAGTSKFIWT